MFKVGLRVSLFLFLVTPALGADKPDVTQGTPVLTVSELLQRASESPLRPADAGLLRAVADLIEQESTAPRKADIIASPAIVQDGAPVPPRSVPDQMEETPRERLVFRLRNVPVADVAKALKEFLDREMKSEDSRRRYQALGKIVLVPEPTSNSLLISSDPTILDGLASLITRLDARPDMVLVEVCIAELTPAVDEKQAAEGPAYPWLGENGAAWLAEAKTQGRLNVLSRPQIMTLDNQPAFIQVGERVPLPADDGSSEEAHVGLTLGVTPRVTPERSVQLELDLERSAILPGAIPRVGKRKIETVVTADDGQTVILGGLMTTTDGKSRGLVVTATPHVNPTTRR